MQVIKNESESKAGTSLQAGPNGLLTVKAAYGTRSAG